MLKRWFIEPRPNVFVGTINRRTREKTLEYIKRNAAGLGMLIISSDNNCQGFRIQTHGDTHRRDTELPAFGWWPRSGWRAKTSRSNPQIPPKCLRKSW